MSDKIGIYLYPFCEKEKRVKKKEKEKDLYRWVIQRGLGDKMNYYESKMKLNAKVSNWCIVKDEDRPHWNELVKDAALSFGFSEKTCLKALKEVSKDSLRIDEETGKLIENW